MFPRAIDSGFNVHDIGASSLVNCSAASPPRKLGPKVLAGVTQVGLSPILVRLCGTELLLECHGLPQ